MYILNLDSTADDLRKESVLICKFNISGEGINDRGLRRPLFVGESPIIQLTGGMFRQFRLDFWLASTLYGDSSWLFPLRLLMRRHK
jgi:hypothetical protein